MMGTTPAVSRLFTHKGWDLSIPAVTTCTSFETKALSRRAPSQSSSFPQMQCVGLTLKTPATAGSDEDRRRYPPDAHRARAWTACSQRCTCDATNRFHARG